MAAPEGAPKVTQFVTTAPLLIPYNSRLPIVVYIPEGYEVRYRIWTAPDDYRAANQS
jgi:ecotin